MRFSSLEFAFLGGCRALPLLDLLKKRIDLGLSTQGLCPLRFGLGPQPFLPHRFPLKPEGLHDDRQPEGQKGDADHQSSDSESTSSHDEVPKWLVISQVRPYNSAHDDRAACIMARVYPTLNAIAAYPPPPGYVERKFGRSRS